MVGERAAGGVSRDPRLLAGATPDVPRAFGTGHRLRAAGLGRPARPLPIARTRRKPARRTDRARRMLAEGAAQPSLPRTAGHRRRPRLTGGMGPLSQVDDLMPWNFAR